MKKFYLHIGPHKTGSTYIQKVLYDNADKLEASNILYPREIVGPQYGHHVIPKLLMEDNQEEVEILFERLLSSELDLLISSENFDRLNHVQIERLKETISDRTFNIIFFKRNSVNLLYSTWQEEVKHGLTTPFSIFCLRHISFPFKSNIINADLVLEPYIQLFGEEALSVIDYDEALKSGDIFDSLSNVLGLGGLADIGIKKVVNKSFPAWETELIRGLNILAITEGFSSDTKVLENYLKVKEIRHVNALISDFQTYVSEYSVEIDFSHSAVIKKIEENFNKKYFSTNNQIAPQKICMLNDNWMLNPKCKGLLGDIYAFVNKAKDPKSV
jgi:hypothetical protein